MPHYREVLKNRNFFLLWIGQLISQFGDRLTQMALIGFVYERVSTSTWQLAKIFSFTIIPVFIVGPIAGVFIDRSDKKYIMAISDFCRAALIVSIPLLWMQKDVLFPIYLVLFLTYALSRFFVPSKMAIVPLLVDKAQLFVANTLINTTGIIAAGLGFMLGGYIVEKVGSRGGFLVDAGTFFVSALFICMIMRASMKQPEPEKHAPYVTIFKKDFFREMYEGFEVIFKHRQLRWSSGIIFLLFSGVGALYITMIVFIQAYLHSVTKVIGFLIAYLAAGGLAGAVFYGKIGHKFLIVKAMFVAMTITGSLIALLAWLLPVYPYFYVASISFFFIGFASAPIVVGVQTLVHNITDSQLHGRLFSTLEIVIHLGFLLFMLITAWVGELIPYEVIIGAVAVLFIIFGIFGSRRKFINYASAE